MRLPNILNDYRAKCENSELPLDLETLINSFLGMFPTATAGCPTQAMETDDSSPEEGPCCSKKAPSAPQAQPEQQNKVPDVPPEPVSFRQDEDFVDLSKEDQTGPSKFILLYLSRAG